MGNGSDAAQGRGRLHEQADTAGTAQRPADGLTSRKSQAVEINDEEALAPEWLAITTTSKPDKAAIKEAIKAGHLIHGAQLISRRSWRIH